MTQETKTTEDMGQAIAMLMQWHALGAAKVNHMLDIPEGSKVEIEGFPDLILSGDAHRAFRLGVQAALAELGELPFYAEYDDQPTH